MHPGHGEDVPSRLEYIVLHCVLVCSRGTFDCAAKSGSPNLQTATVMSSIGSGASKQDKRPLMNGNEHEKSCKAERYSCMAESQGMSTWLIEEAIRVSAMTAGPEAKWLHDLDRFGLPASQTEVEGAVEDLEKRGEEITLCALVNSLLDARASSPPCHFPSSPRHATLSCEQEEMCCAAREQSQKLGLEGVDLEEETDGESSGGLGISEQEPAGDAGDSEYAADGGTRFRSNEAGCSKPAWWCDLASLGFSEAEVESAVESLENAGREVTAEVVANVILENLGDPCDETAAAAVEESEPHSGEDDQGGRSCDMDVDVKDVADDATGARTGDYRLEQLVELGYDFDVVTVAVSYHALDDPVEKVVDWLDAYLLSDTPSKPKAEGVDLVVEQVKSMVQLSPRLEDAIRKHDCKDVTEALDLQKALELQELVEDDGQPNESDTFNRRRCASARDWDPDVIDTAEDLDSYDMGRTGLGRGEECSVIRKQRKTKQRGGRSTVYTLQREDYYSFEEDSRTGHGVPGGPVIPRTLPESLARPPYFYFENVASMPKFEWDKISSELYGIKPEFVDALHFSACRRARGYVHNLPVEGRQLLIPQPPMTIQELFPETSKHWPAWDLRRKLNCIDSRSACHTVVEPIVESIKQHGARLVVDENFRKEMLIELKKWNLVWTGPSQVSPMSAEEMEVVLGYDVNHTRGVVNKTDRWKCLGSCFQVNTVAYHLSVLKPLFPQGMNVISLFAGIGGAEVALHKNGIQLNVVVSIELNDKVRQVVSNWWQVTGQKGHLVHHIHDVKDLTKDKLVDLQLRYGKFDLLIGGSPCNNLSGSNRVSRTGLAGEHSSLFYEYKRILHDLRLLTGPP